MVEQTPSDAAPPSVEETMAGLALESATVDETHVADPRAVSAVDDTMVSGHATPTKGPSRRQPKRGSETPASIGRYIVLGRLGAGAMGEVLAAYDPRLDRKVAVKRIHPGGGSLDAARIRLEREAQALAKLDHRNVVKVHDVIVHHDSLFVAMELVEGETLGEWMRGEDNRPRPWREIVPVFEAFGAGLAAVHAAGLVHRDIKPGNVMIGADGRVRVMDFGLARLDGEHADPGLSAVREIPEELAELRDSIASSQAQTQELTQAGAMLGTPAYMAPEQFSGIAATARSDQFSFCVALHEALYGVRPFSGDSVLELCAAVIEGKIDEPPRDLEVPVPSWLRAVVLRGLAHAASDRFASMDELLVALGTGELRRRRRRYAAVGIGLAAAGLGFLGMQRWDLAQRERACVSAGEVVDELWNPQTQARLEAGMLASELSYAATSVERARPWLDDHARSWATQAEAACVAATVERRWDADTHDRASWCLEQRRSALASLIDRLIHAEGLDVQYAVESAAALESPDLCTDVRTLDSIGPPPSPALRPQVLALQDRLALAARVDSSEDLGKGEDSPLQIARAIERDARALPWLPLAIRAQRVEARLLRLSGELDEAESRAAAAYREAARAGLWAEASSAAILLGSIVAGQPLRAAEARLWLESAEIARAHASDPHALLRSEIEASLASVELATHTFEVALAHGEQARAGLERVFGTEHPRVGDALHDLAAIHGAKGDYVAALALELEALALFRRSFGQDHPQVGRSLSGVGKIRVKLGERDEAAALFEEAMEIFELDELSRPDLIRTLNLLGMMRYDQGRYDDARAYLTRATELVEATPNISGRLEAETLNNLGVAYRGLGEYGKARELYERALQIFVEVLGTDSEEVAASHNNIAILLYLEGDIEGCAKQLELSIEIDERILGPRHPSLVDKIVNLGRTRAALGDYEQALEDVGRALAISELALGRDSAENGPLYWRLGIISTQAGDYPAALAAFERGLVLLEKFEKVEKDQKVEGGWAKELARLRLSFGTALWDAPAKAGRDRARGRALVERAREGFVAVNDPSQVTACDDWLAEHR